VALCVKQLRLGHPIALREGRLNVNERLDKSIRMLRIESGVHSQWPDANGRYRAGPTTAHRRDAWAASEVRFAGRDARKPGRCDLDPIFGSS